MKINKISFAIAVATFTCGTYASPFGNAMAQQSEGSEDTDPYVFCACFESFPVDYPDVIVIAPPNGKAPSTVVATNTVPEPGSFTLLGLGLAGMALLRKRRG